MTSKQIINLLWVILWTGLAIAALYGALVAGNRVHFFVWGIAVVAIALFATDGDADNESLYALIKRIIK